VTIRWKSLCHECHNAKKYDQAYRQREREKDLDGFLQREAKKMKEWRIKNTEHWKEYTKAYMQSVNGKISVIKTSAKQRGISYDDRDKELFKELVQQPCWYCGNAKTSLDRLDSGLGYTRTNVVACCSTCNFMKCDMSVSEFLENVARVALHNADKVALIDAATLDKSTGMGRHKNPDPERKRMMLTEDQEAKLNSDPCYLCGGPGGGIDRINATKCYTPENCAGCCKSCNYMKKDYTLDYVLFHTNQVYQYSFQKA
jgi:hypothetical protein